MSLACRILIVVAVCTSFPAMAQSPRAQRCPEECLECPRGKATGSSPTWASHALEKTDLEAFFDGSFHCNWSVAMSPVPPF